jgi:hypothetical protein
MERPMPPCVVEKHLEKLRAFIVIKEMESQLNTVAICRWGMKAFISITGAAMKAQNPDAMADFLDDGGCESLLSVMSMHGDDSEIAAHGCLVISILAWSLREMKEFLGEIGACETVLYVVSLHMGDPIVSEHGSGAIGLLAKGNNPNSFRIAEADGCDVIAQLGNFGFNVRSDRCVYVATNVCYAISPLCEAVNSARLVECGACALVTELVKLHLKNEEFAAAAAKALCSLASLNLVLREELGKVGACEYVMDIIAQHRNPFILQDGCEAILHLSLNPSNTTMLGDCGACEVLVNAFRTTLADIESGCEVCAGAMLNIATYGIAAKQNRFRLTDAGAVQVLQQTLSRPGVSLRTRESGAQLLQMLGAEDVSGGDASRRRSRPPSGNNLVNIIHGSQMKGDTVPLQVEVRETVEVVGLGTPGSVASRSAERNHLSNNTQRGPSDSAKLPISAADEEGLGYDDYGEYAEGEGFHDNSTHEI